MIEKLSKKFDKLNFLVRRKFFKEELQKPICIFCYHKVGTILFQSIFEKISIQNGWNFELLPGYQAKFPKKDVMFFFHSIVDLNRLKNDFRGVHIVRDPRDIVISGYLYHQRTDEGWCTNTNFNFGDSHIGYPFVPPSQAYKPEEWKREYLSSLNGKSYQENLKSLSQEDGIEFEMKHYASWTIEEMRKWDYNRDEILEIKFEDIMLNFDSTFLKIFQHFSFSERQIQKVMKIAIQHDLNRKDDDEIMDNKHVSGKKVVGKWEDYFTEKHKKLFKQRFGDILIKLGYENSNDW